MTGNYFKLITAALFSAMTMALAAISGCSSNGDSVTAQGDFPVLFAMRASSVTGNPTSSVQFAAGGDLMMVDLASPSAPMVNLTSGYTQGKGDVSDPEVSYDGKRALFAMKGPNDATWHIWEINLSTRVMRRIITDDAIANQGDDVDPAYLPDGRIVFVSNRQSASKQQLVAANTEPYSYLDEYDREPTTLLSVMNADGGDIHEISANQSHDRNPTVLLDGEIMFARWDHLGARNHFPIFKVNPDGTNLFIDYGAFSPGNSFLHPREMPNNQVMSSLMPLSGTHGGGALMGIDVVNFSDNDEPISPAITGNGQAELTLYNIDYETRMGVAPYGRYTTPYPLWDGTNRALVSWTPSRPVDTTDPVTGETTQTEGLPLYGVYMFDLDKKTLRPIAIPPEGWCYVDPVAVAPRPVPNSIPDKILDADLAAAGYGVINVKSVYDTDNLDLMGVSKLAPGETIPQTAPPPNDLRASVADIAKLKDPAQTTAAQRPPRFLRVSKAVPTPPGLSRETIGETELEMEQILGYTDVQPDGSVRIIVPANTPIALSVLDANGMAFQRHTDWLQVRPGETRTCNGCHSPRRGVALNISPIAGYDPNTLLTPESGESMAETWTRLNPATLTNPQTQATFQIAAGALNTDMSYVDVWTDPAQAGREPDPSLTISYVGLKTAAPVAGVINFPDHIAPIFTIDRGANTCTACHNNENTNDPLSVGLDLRSTISGTGRLESYEALTLGPVEIDPATGLPVITEDGEGDLMVQRSPALVRAGGSGDTSRSSPFFEVLLEKQLNSGTALPKGSVDHSRMLNASELRILAEWADLGVQYYNDPFNVSDPNAYRSLDNLRGVTGLSEKVFDSDIHPILIAQCASCHQPFGGDSTTVNSNFLTNQFVLTGDEKGDYDVTLTMVTNICNPPENPLLLWPTSTGNVLFPHPQVGTPPMPVMSTTDANYKTISNWIASGTCS